jgi:tRNA (guanine-N1)-methyltransferase
MKPEPWGEAFDSILTPESVVIFPSPAGERFTQSTARELADAPHLVFGCGRYEGIDQRVVDNASSRATVREISLGDYVLNGGEVAAMAMIEAIGRLIPGVVGNPESLTEESHEDGLLEYPSYTKPGATQRQPRRNRDLASRPAARTHQTSPPRPVSLTPVNFPLKGVSRSQNHPFWNGLAPLSGG